MIGSIKKWPICIGKANGQHFELRINVIRTKIVIVENAISTHMALAWPHLPPSPSIRRYSHPILFVDVKTDRDLINLSNPKRTISLYRYSCIRFIRSLTLISCLICIVRSVMQCWMASRMRDSLYAGCSSQATSIDNHMSFDSCIENYV